MNIHREDIACAEMLLKPAKRILSEKNAVKRLPVDERIRLWNEIEENFNKFRDGSCGTFISDMDNHIRSQFMVSQIILALTFEENGETFEPCCICSDRDFEIFRKISRYDMFEILSPADVRKKLELHDDEILTLLSGFYYDMEHWVSSAVEDPSVDLPIRFFLKKKWKQYRSPIDKVLSQNPDRWMHIIGKHHEKIQNELKRIKLVIHKRDEEILKIEIEQKKKEDEIRNLRSIADQLKQDLSESADEIENHRRMLEESSRTVTERGQLIELQKQVVAAREEEIRLMMARAAESSRELQLKSEEIETHKRMLEASAKTRADHEHSVEQQRHDFAAQEEELRLLRVKAGERNRELEKEAGEIRLKTEELHAAERKIIDEKARIDVGKCELEQAGREIAGKEEEFHRKALALEEKARELDLIRQKWNSVQETGSRCVRAGDARQYEMNFIGRTGLKIGGQKNRIAILNRPFVVESVVETKEADRDKEPAESDGTPGARETPENRSVTVSLLEGKLLGTKERYQFEARFLSRTAQFARFGFDADPLTLQELRPLLEDAEKSARTTGIPVFLCIASPTGFASEVSDFFNNAEMHRNFLSRYVSACFVDLETAQLIYNPADEVARSFLPWCETVFEREKIEKARNVVRQNIDQQFREDGFARFDKAHKSCRESGVADEGCMKAAFYEYGKEKKRSVKHVESVGLVMME